MLKRYIEFFFIVLLAQNIAANPVEQKFKAAVMALTHDAHAVQTQLADAADKAEKGTWESVYSYGGFVRGAVKPSQPIWLRALEHDLYYKMQKNNPDLDFADPIYSQVRHAFHLPQESVNQMIQQAVRQHLSPKDVGYQVIELMRGVLLCEKAPVVWVNAWVLRVSAFIEEVIF